jgi:hypothetical protein
MTVAMRSRSTLHGAWVLVLAVVVVLPSAAPARADGERMYEPRFREGAPSDPLVEGPPRLSRGHLNAYVDLLEAAFDVALPSAEEQDLRDSLENEFHGAGTEEREAFVSLVEAIVRLREQARRGEHAGLRDGLRRFRAAIDRRMLADRGRRSHRLLARVLERRHQEVWAGEPAVKGLSVDAYMETIVFVAGLARNEAPPLTPGQRSALIDYLGRDLAQLPKSVRAQLAAMHRTWLWVKARWDRAKDGRRFAMRWEAVKLLAKLVPAQPPLTVRPGTDLPSYAREAARVADAQRAFDAVTSLARNPEAVLAALTKGLELDRDRPITSLLYR